MVNIKLNKMVQKGPYLDIRRLRKYLRDSKGRTPPLIIITGARGVGKTTTARNDLKTKLKAGKKFIWLFRKDEELKQKKLEIFEPLGLWVEGMWIYETVTKTRKRKGSKGQEMEEYKTKGAKVGRLHSVNMATDLRSGLDYVKEGYTNIYWDEFQDELGKEVSDEASKFLSILETTLRTSSKDVEIILMSNNVREDGALLSELGIKKMPGQGEIMILSDPDYGNWCGLYVPYTTKELAQKRKGSVVGVATKNSSYAKYAYDNKSRFVSSNQIRDKLPNSKPQWAFYWHDKAFCVYLSYDDGSLWIGEDIHSSLKVYGFTKTDALRYNCQYSDGQYMKAILNAKMLGGMVYFENREKLDFIGDFIK